LTEFAHGLRILSTIACGVVLIAFVLFAADQRNDDHQFEASQAALAEPAVAPEPEHGAVRGTLEDVNSMLVGPFEGIASSDDEWVQHGIPALLALIAYGLLARLLIAYIPARR
jgi:hypothetical protein